MRKLKILQQRLQDRRSRKVVFLSHCILNENTRYLGGACSGCVRPIVEHCLEHNVGMVQMPCPEQQAWGGILKPWFLKFYGIQGTLLYPLRRLLLPILLFYTRLRYRQIARAIANQIQDYLASDYLVIAVVGVDGSPSCGVETTLNMAKSFDQITKLDIERATTSQINSIVQQCAVHGKGLFIALLQQELKKRHITVPYSSHDLITEINSHLLQSEHLN